jgi:glycosyltransferase involved in cell wall biosynthesis
MPDKLTSDVGDCQWAMKKILYLTYDGLTDHLGQSQVLAYLANLADDLTHIDVISFEKKDNFVNNIELVNEAITNKNINWQPLSYTKNPPIISTLKDLFLCWLRAKKLNKEKNYDIVHCRGHLVSLIGKRMKKEYGTRFIFDMRAWWADEKIESGHWKGPIFKLVYICMKKLEVKLMRKSDYTISLTYAGKDEIVRNNWKESGNVKVIPTGVDLDHFKKVDFNKRQTVRAHLGIPEKAKVLIYSGSVGGNYAIEKILSSARAFKRLYTNGRTLILSKTEPEVFLNTVNQEELRSLNIIFLCLSYRDVPAYLMVGDFGLIIYQKAFSLVGRSPTKLSEYWACGLPVLSFKGVGDLDQLQKKYPFALFLIEEFEEEQIINGLKSLNGASSRKDLRRAAIESFDKSKGVKLYKTLYDLLSSKRNNLTAI